MIIKSLTNPLELPSCSSIRPNSAQESPASSSLAPSSFSFVSATAKKEPTEKFRRPSFMKSTPWPAEAVTSLHQGTPLAKPESTRPLVDILDHALAISPVINSASLTAATRQLQITPRVPPSTIPSDQALPSPVFNSRGSPVSTLHQPHLRPLPSLPVRTT